MKGGGKVKLALGLLVSAGALVLLLRGIDGAALVRAASRLSAGGLLLALALLTAGYALRVVRWWWMLAAFDRRLRVRDCVTPFVASIALNNVLPLRAGDAVRAFGFQKRLGLPAATVLGSVVLERLLDLAMLLAIFFAGAAAAPAEALPAGMARAAAVVAAGAIAVLVLLPLLGPPVARRLERLGGASPSRGVQLVRKGAALLLDSFSLLRTPGRALALLPLTLGVWLCEGAVFATIAADLASSTPPWAAWFAMATGTLATLLPSTPGYVGTFDWFASLGLAAFGAAREVATAFALSAHAVLWVPVTAVGLALLAWQGGASAFRPESQSGPRGAAVQRP
jgi:uncharacterized membrane protein YbhN (UPF0104 family)